LIDGPVGGSKLVEVVRVVFRFYYMDRASPACTIAMTMVSPLIASLIVARKSVSMSDSSILR